MRDGVEVEETPASLVPQGFVDAVRKEAGEIDYVNFKNCAVRFVDYVKGRTSTGKVSLICDGYRAHLSWVY